MSSLRAKAVVLRGAPSRLMIRRLSLAVRPFLMAGGLVVVVGLTTVGGSLGAVVFLFLPFLATVDHSGAEAVEAMGGGILGGWVLGSLAGFELFSLVGGGYGIGVGVSGCEAVA